MLILLRQLPPLHSHQQLGLLQMHLSHSAGQLPDIGPKKIRGGSKI